MSHNARQSLSALMDDEGDDLELRRVLASLEGAPEAAESWRRYHLVRSLMRREADLDVTSDLSAGIMARLEGEPIPSSATREPSVSAARPAWRRGLPLARGAGIAAAVSLMVISGVQFYSGASPFGGPSTGGEVAGLADSDTFGAPSPRQAPATQASASKVPSLVDLPMFQGAPSARSGVMTVGAGASSPMMLSPSQRQSAQQLSQQQLSKQSRAIDQQQALLLQSYLNRHAEGAAASTGDAWLPLLRASGNESLSNR